MPALLDGVIVGHHVSSDPAAGSSVMTTDPVRIVPVYPVEEITTPAHGAAAAPPPELVYNGGALLGAVEVFTVFWGPWWQSEDGAALAERLNGFFDYALTSELMDELAEYDAGGTAIAHGKRTGTATIAEPALGSTITDAAIQDTVRELITAGTVPPVDANTLYFLYLTPDVAVVQGGSRSCQAFCGYHNAAGDGIYYAVMPYPGCAGCAGGLALFDALTSTSSHELCEAVTDPVPGAGWYDDAHGEIGDICAWQTKQLGGYNVQLEWSNRRGACI
jgi:hypothetical protein